MDITITSQDDERRQFEKGSRGKTAHVFPASFKVSVADETLSLDATDWSLYGTGARGGKERHIRHGILVKFSQKDLIQMLDAAISAGLIEIGLRVPNASRGKKAK